MAETATEVREQAQEKAQQAQEKVQDAASNVRSNARTQINERSTEVGQRVNSTADDIRSVGQQLREQGKDQPARLADQAAQHVERVGSWLRDSDSDTLLSDVEDFGRRQPWAFALGGLALGIAASRFLKASSAQRYEQRRTQFDQYRTNGQAGRVGNGQSPAFGNPATYGSDRETRPLDAGSATGVPQGSPADAARGLGTTPPPPSGGTQER